MKPTLQKGQLQTWHDDRGFGFIQPPMGGQQVFLHISALNHSRRRPRTGDLIRYELTIDGAGKVRAANAAIAGTPLSRVAHALMLAMQVSALALLPLYGSLHMAMTIRMPVPLFLYFVMSVLTFWLYAEDKIWAQQHQWRVPEVVLHGCELIGGWLGAFVAQRTLRHKSRKPSYQAVFWTIVCLHLVGWVGWFVVVRLSGIS